MLKKTIEKNPKDMEAYKLLSQIMIQQGKIDEALEMLTDIAQNNENGDIYYLMAKIFELNEDKDSQKDCLELALTYKETLTFPIASIKQELKEIS
jgi:tetratricopeptide (TPR) repeat protein